MDRSPLDLLSAVLDCPEMYLVSPNTQMLKEEIRRVLQAQRETREEIVQLTQEAA
ncbi:MAG TPA: hypothetical protein VGN57_19125 [Pirellulaceae bacterium]|jgi:hypothetical protein|nr:hypothetical protein [Pirellulaceae bacterium]